MESIDEQGAGELWKALASCSAAQTTAIAAGDASELDALLEEIDRLLAALARRDAAADAARDPSLLALAQAVQANEEAAEAALLEAQVQLSEKLSGLRVRRGARQAFAQGAQNLAPGQSVPRFFDHHG